MPGGINGFLIVFSPSFVVTVLVSAIYLKGMVTDSEREKKISG